ncbi:MAG: YigZ family protein [Ignavibacteria bacterium]|nr:YigZ family protein [Ignavibacteria bacterium]
MKQSPTKSNGSPTLFTIQTPLNHEIIVRRSKFIAFLHPATSKEETLSILQKIKRDHWSAVHHCYAYRLGVKGLEYRMSDDGEPSGTAGKPILFAIQKSELTNVILIVVRYFGGVKLGIGPLSRAYLDTSLQVINAAVRVPMVQMASLDVHCTYDDVSRVIGVFEEAGAKYDVMYADAVTFAVVVEASKVALLTTQIIERTNSRAGYSNVTLED